MLYWGFLLATVSYSNVEQSINDIPSGLLVRLTTGIGDLLLGAAVHVVTGLLRGEAES